MEKLLSAFPVTVKAAADTALPATFDNPPVSVAAPAELSVIVPAVPELATDPKFKGAVLEIEMGVTKVAVVEAVAVDWAFVLAIEAIVETVIAINVFVNDIFIYNRLIRANIRINLKTRSLACVFTVEIRGNYTHKKGKMPQFVVVFTLDRPIDIYIELKLTRPQYHGTSSIHFCYA